MGKHTHPKTLRLGSFTFKLALLAVGEHMLFDVKDRLAFNRLRDKVKLACKVQVMAKAGLQYHCTLYHCSDVVTPMTNCLIMRITRLEDKPPTEEQA